MYLLLVLEVFVQTFVALAMVSVTMLWCIKLHKNLLHNKFNYTDKLEDTIIYFIWPAFFLLSTLGIGAGVLVQILNWVGLIPNLNQ